MQLALDRESVDFLFCTPKDTAPVGRLYYWSYIYYLSKYYEFLDTVLLALRKKPTTFLHVFHHAVVVIMAWLWVDQVQSLQFIGLLTNTAVHVVMYYYYHLTTIGKSPLWKKFITTMQIVQFVSRCVSHMLCSCSRISKRWQPHRPSWCPALCCHVVNAWQAILRRSAQRDDRYAMQLHVPACVRMVPAACKAGSGWMRGEWRSGLQRWLQRLPPAALRAVLHVNVQAP
jgi:hypothetical protein